MRAMTILFTLGIFLTSCSDGCTPTAEAPTSVAGLVDGSGQDSAGDVDADENGKADADAEADTKDAKADADAAVVIPDVITPCMADPLIDPVVLGEPCTPVGARRCSDLYAKPWPGNADQTSGPQVGVNNRCIRPFVAECAEVQTGEPVWVARSCKDVTATVKSNDIWDCAMPQSCEESGGPAVCYGEGAVTIAGEFLRCARSQLGMTRCRGLHEVQVCMEAKDAKFATKMPPWSHVWAIQGCTVLAEGATYWVTAAVCSNELGLQVCPGVPMNTSPFCNYYPDGTARCDKTCDELLKSYKQWGKKP